MHRVLLFILGLAAFSHQHCHHHNHRHHRVQNSVDYHSRVFNEVANEVIAIDRKSQQFCEAHSNGATKELFQKNRYLLKRTLEGFSENDIQIEVRHRVVYINAFKAEPARHYTEVKELPAFVDANEAKFTFEDGILEVVFPTKNEINNTCNPNINDNVINVSKFTMFNEETGPRFGPIEKQTDANVVSQ